MGLPDADPANEPAAELSRPAAWIPGVEGGEVRQLVGVALVGVHPADVGDRVELGDDGVADEEGDGVGHNQYGVEYSRRAILPILI